MSVRLLVRQRSEAGSDKPNEVVLDQPEITLGRDKNCQVVLPLQAVSRNHARISQDGSLFFIEDLGSAFGTQVNGKQLPKGEKRLLRNGDVIGIAQFDVTFDRLADKAPNGDKTSLLARNVVKDVMRGLGDEGPYFRVMNGPREGEKIPISDAHELIIGREEGVEIVLKDDLVSRKHAKVRRDWSGTHVEDLESRNGIRVNKKRVNRKTLKDRDELEVGGIRLLYLDPTEVREAPVVLPSGQNADEPDGEPTNSGLVKEEEPPPEPEPEPPVDPQPSLSSEQPAAELPPEEPLSEAGPEMAPMMLTGEESSQVADAPTGFRALLAGGKSQLVFLGAMALVGLTALTLILVVLFSA